jgi:hypothetical protein
LRNSPLQFRFVIKFVDDALGDLRQVEIDVGLHGDVDLRALPVKSGKP